MNAEALGNAANVIVVLGLPLTVLQLWLGRRQERTAFEDGMTTAYRDLLGLLPVSALTGGNPTLTPEQENAMFRYFDLTNEQAFLRRKRRVSFWTWVEWCEGIQGSFALVAFESAWGRLDGDARFQELGRLRDASFEYDPAQILGVPIGLMGTIYIKHRPWRFRVARAEEHDELSSARRETQ